MILRRYFNNVHESTRKKYAMQFFIFVLLICTFACSEAAAEFVPFVIPAKSDANSPIAVTSYEPILTDSDRLLADSGHFYRAGKRVRLWGVNLSFGANLPTHEDAPFVAARLAAAGVNTIRCHHLDTSRWPRGIWNAADGKDISPEALDRLDFLQRYRSRSARQAGLFYKSACPSRHLRQSQPARRPGAQRIPWIARDEPSI